MEAHVQAETRNHMKKGKALRREGKIPGIVYGGGKEAVPVAVNEKDLLPVLKNHRSAVITLHLQGEETHAVLQDVQQDPLTGEWLHADFLRVRKDRPLKSRVRLRFIGESPGVKAGGILQVQLPEIEVEALPQDMPAEITVDIEQFDLGQSLHIADLSIPPRIKVLHSPDALVATILTPKKEAAEKPEHTEQPPAEQTAEKTQNKNGEK